MNDIDTCQYGLKPQCAEITNSIMIDFLASVKNYDITVESINVINELCSNCTSFTAKE